MAATDSGKTSTEFSPTSVKSRFNAPTLIMPVIKHTHNKSKMDSKSEAILIKSLHSAVEKCDLRQINTIVRKRDINHLYGGKTITHLLIENMNDENIQIVEETLRDEFDNILVGYEESNARKLFKCLQTVLQRSTKVVNLNILDNTENTPITILLNNTFKHDIFIKKDVIKYFLKKKIFIDYDMPTQGNQTVRKLFQKHMPEINIPSPIAIACYAGDAKELECLLASDALQSQRQRREPLLAIVVNELCKSKDNEKYHKCLDILLEMESIPEYIDLVDEDNYAAIHYAVISNNKEVIMKLLNVSLYMGSNRLIAKLEDVHVRWNIFYPENLLMTLWIWLECFYTKPKFALQTIDLKIIEEYLDTCITTNKIHETHENYQLKINYNCYNTIGNTEMSIFHYMSQKPDLQLLLQHPTILSFIYFRWLKFKMTFYISLMLSAFYFFFAIFYFTFCNGWHCFSLTYWFVIVAFKVIVLINSLFNYQHIIFLILLLLFPMSFIDNYSDFPFYKFSILLSAIGLLFCLKGAQLFTLSKHFYLFQRVLINFMKMMVFYAICIFAFAFAFYKNARDLINESNKENGISHSNESDFAMNFDTAHMALLKTIIMSTGEFEAGEADFIKNYIFYGFFITFIVAITIVLSNLLIGLAVNDTTDILRRADLEDIIFRINFMSRNEAIAKFLHVMFKNSHICKLSNLIYPSEHSRSNSIILYPNQSFDSGSGKNYIKKIIKLFRNKKKIGMKKFFKNDVNSQIPTDKPSGILERGRIFKRLLSRSEPAENYPLIASADDANTRELAEIGDGNTQSLGPLVSETPILRGISKNLKPSAIHQKYNKIKPEIKVEKIKKRKIIKKSEDHSRSKELMSIIMEAKNVILKAKKKNKIKNSNILDYIKEVDEKIDDVIINLLLKISKNQTVDSAPSPSTVQMAPKFTASEPVSRKLVRLKNINYQWNTFKSNVRILRSASHEEHKEKFVQYNENQSTAMVAAAIAMAHISQPSKWRQNTMNAIIFEGIKYYESCMERKKSSNTSQFLSPDDLMPETIMFKHQILLIRSPAQIFISRIFDEKMNKILAGDDDVHGILVCNEQSCGIMKIANIYYLYDSHGNGPDGCAYILEFREYKHMLEELKCRNQEIDHLLFYTLKCKYSKSREMYLSYNYNKSKK